MATMMAAMRRVPPTAAMAAIAAVLKGPVGPRTEDEGPDEGVPDDGEPPEGGEGMLPKSTVRGEPVAPEQVHETVDESVFVVQPVVTHVSVVESNVAHVAIDMFSTFVKLVIT